MQFCTNANSQRYTQKYSFKLNFTSDNAVNVHLCSVNACALHLTLNSALILQKRSKCAKMRNSQPTKWPILDPPINDGFQSLFVLFIGLGLERSAELGHSVLESGANIEMAVYPLGAGLISKWL